MAKKLRCMRWRTLALGTLTLLLTLNLLVFFTLPSFRNSEVFAGPDVAGGEGGPQGGGGRQTLLGPREFTSRDGPAHVPVPRRIENKSNFTSDSGGADAGVKGGDAGGGAAHEVGVAGDRPARRAVPGGQSGAADGGDSIPGPAAPSVLGHPEGHPPADRRRGGISEIRRAELPQQMAVKNEAGTALPPGSRINFTDPDVDTFIRMLEDKGLLDILPGHKLEDENYWMFLKRQRLRRKAGMHLPAYKNHKSTSNWERFHSGIRQHYLYDPDSPVVDRLLRDLATKTIIDAEQKEGGTQLKLIMTLEDEGQALFKPMRFPRDTQTLPDHFYFADYERHIAEIAAFHLDRVLGYNRVPPVSGRVVNMTSDIRQLTDSKLARTFFISPAGNLCFHGSCSYYCDSGHPICGHPDQLEASLMAFLPQENLAHRQTWRNPWKRSYSKHRKAYWEVYDDLCEKVKKRPPYNTGRRLLDIVDMSVLDFLMGNLDRHHYETFRAFGNDSIIIHLDHGRGFGKFHEDDLSCLAPLLQCCMVRLSTLQRLVRLYRGPLTLGAALNATLAADPLAPVLVDPLLTALERRLVTVLREVWKCTGAPLPPPEEGGDPGGGGGIRSLKEVVIDDGVY